MIEPIVIVAYDPAWPDLFAREAMTISGLLADPALVIEHVGSTAVPGLGAKPVIDIMIGLPDLDEADRTFAPLATLGYGYVPEFEAEIPERRYFRKERDGVRTHQIHMVAIGGGFWRRHLLFRDYLRQHPDRAAAYEALKRDLAVRFRLDRTAYTDAKTAFVQETERLAAEALRHRT